MFIAELAKRISNGKLGCRQGMILVSDKGYENPLVTAHAWNTYEGKRFDLSHGQSVLSNRVRDGR